MLALMQSIVGDVAVHTAQQWKGVCDVVDAMGMSLPAI
jgi:hypothetical protein